MTKLFILVNTLLIPYHAAVVFAIAMSMGQAHTNQEIVNNLYWIVPVNLALASIPNMLITLYYFIQKKKTNLLIALLKAEVYVVLIQILLHGALILFSIYGPDI